MSTVTYISNADCGRHDTGWGHPEHVGRLRAIPRALRNDVELFHLLDHRESRHASAEELALAHDPAYIASIEALAPVGSGPADLSDAGQRYAFEREAFPTAALGWRLPRRMCPEQRFDGRKS